MPVCLNSIFNSNSLCSEISKLNALRASSPLHGGTKRQARLDGNILHPKKSVFRPEVVVR